MILVKLAGSSIVYQILCLHNSICNSFSVQNNTRIDNWFNINDITLDENIMCASLGSKHNPPIIHIHDSKRNTYYETDSKDVSLSALRNSLSGTNDSINRILVDTFDPSLNSETSIINRSPIYVVTGNIQVRVLYLQNSYILCVGNDFETFYNNLKQTGLYPDMLVIDGRDYTKGIVIVKAFYIFSKFIRYAKSGFDPVNYCKVIGKIYNLIDRNSYNTLNSGD